jgi:hypothetical protein
MQVWNSSLSSLRFDVVENVQRDDNTYVTSPSFNSGNEVALSTILDAWNTTGGGGSTVNWGYKQSSTATERALKSWMAEVHVSVKDFGAVGDGAANDTTAIQNTINVVGAAGGGIVYFPPGTYLINAALTSATGGILFRGAGRSASVIKQSGGALGAFTISGSSIAFRDLSILASTISTGSAIAGSATGLVIEHVTIGAGTGGTGCFDISLDLTSASSQVFVLDCNFIQNNGHGAARSIRANTVTGLQVVSSLLSCTSGGATLELIATTGVTLMSVTINGGAMTSTVDPKLVQIGSLYGSAVQVASGGTVTPNLLLGNRTVVEGVSTGVAYIINAPTPVPTLDGARFTLVLWNHSAGAITGYTLNAAYHRSATAISLVDTHRTTLVFEYDLPQAVWREVSISDST